MAVLGYAEAYELNKILVRIALTHLQWQRARFKEKKSMLSGKCFSKMFLSKVESFATGSDKLIYLFHLN